MDLIPPYITEELTAYFTESISSSLSLALWLMDDYTKRRPIGNVKVLIKKENLKSFVNLSGYHLFTDLPLGSYEVTVESDFYFPENTTVDTSDTSRLKPKSPVIEVTLKPKPSYPFPNNATLVRGLVSNSAPIANAIIKVASKTIESETDERGEFSLYFKGIKKEDITIEVEKNGDCKSIPATIEEGKTTSLGIILFS
jgi:hypothetical protein